MATTQNEHSGNGTLRRFSFTFPYIKEDDVKVSVRTSNDDVTTLASTAYTFPSATEIQLNALTGNATTWQETTGAPKSGVTLRVFRETDIDNPKAVFYPGSSVRAQDLNDNTLQNLYAEQERQNRAVDRIGGSTMQANLTMQQSDIIFDGDTIGGSATTLSVVNPTANQTYQLPNLAQGTYNLISTGDTNTVTSTMVDNSLTDANIASGAEIAVDKLADGAARQLLQTAADGTSVEWTSNVDIPGTLDVTGNTTFDGSVTATTFTGNLTGNVTGGVTGNADTATDLAAATKITASEQVNHTPNDTTYYTTSAADNRFWRQDAAGNEVIQTSATWTANDSRVATTGAIDARIVNLVTEVGGFVPIANETSFPATNPDINNGAGTIVSIGALANNLAFNGSGVATITNGAGTGNTVTINGGPQSTTIASNSGALVETTTTLHTYTWHRTTPDGANVNTVANAIANVNTVANNISDVQTVANNNADIDTLAAISADITTLAHVEDGTDATDAIQTVAASIADVQTVAADLNENTSEIDTVANAITNVNNVGNSITNVNTVATNINSVNDFADRYTVSASTPTNPNDGDLWWDQANDLMKAYDATGTQWVAITTASQTGLQTTGGTMTGQLVLDDGRQAGSPVLSFTGDTNTGIYSSGAESVNISSDGADRLQVTSTFAKASVPTEIEVTTSTTNGVTTALTVESQSSGTPAAGIGVGMDFAVETAANNVEIGAQVEAVTTDVSSTSEDVDLVVNLMAGGAAAAEKFRVTSAGNVTVTGGTVQSGNNTDLTLTGGGNGTIVLNDNTSVNGNLTLSTAGADLVFNGTDDSSNARTITLQAPTSAANFGANYTLTLPVNDGATDQFLQTDGSGNLSFQTINLTGAATNVVTLNNATTTDGFTIGTNRNVGMMGPLTINENETIEVGDGSLFKVL